MEFGQVDHDGCAVLVVAALSLVSVVSRTAQQGNLSFYCKTTWPTRNPEQSAP
jgi:hypothetical protein